MKRARIFSGLILLAFAALLCGLADANTFSKSPRIVRPAFSQEGLKFSPAAIDPARPRFFKHSMEVLTEDEKKVKVDYAVEHVEHLFSLDHELSILEVKCSESQLLLKVESLEISDRLLHVNGAIISGGEEWGCTDASQQATTILRKALSVEVIDSNTILVNTREAMFQEAFQSANITIDSVPVPSAKKTQSYVRSHVADYQPKVTQEKAVLTQSLISETKPNTFKFEGSTQCGSCTSCYSETDFYISETFQNSPITCPTGYVAAISYIHIESTDGSVFTVETKVGGGAIVSDGTVNTPTPCFHWDGNNQKLLGYTNSYMDIKVTNKNRYGYCYIKYDIGIDCYLSTLYQYCPSTNGVQQICTPTYGWVVGDFGVCSGDCSSAVRTRTVVCEANDYGVPETYCTNTKPATTESCRPSTCPALSYSWVTGSWGTCEGTCGTGVQRRSVECKSNEGTTATDVTLCTSTKPTDTQPCTLSQPCQSPVTYSWVSTNWTSCSVSCGPGVQFMQYKCVDNYGSTQTNDKCTHIASPTMLTQECNLKACVTYDWVTDAWDQCSAICNGGTQSRTIRCVSSTGVVYPEDSCTSTPKPNTQQSCNTQLCAAGTCLCDNCILSTSFYQYQYVLLTCETGTWPKLKSLKYSSSSLPVYVSVTKGSNKNVYYPGIGFSDASKQCYTWPNSDQQFQAVGDQNENVMNLYFWSDVSTYTSKKDVTYSIDYECATSFGYKWVPGVWTECSVTCGSGTTTRDITCQNAYDLAINSSFCDGQTKPSQYDSCNTNKCTDVSVNGVMKGYVYYAGDEVSLYWTKVRTGTVNIYLYKWYTGLIANLGNYPANTAAKIKLQSSWKLNGAAYYFRLEFSSATGTFDSEYFYLPVNYFKITSPTGQNSFQPGDTIDVTWINEGMQPTTVDVILYKQVILGTDTAISIIRNVDASSGTAQVYIDPSNVDVPSMNAFYVSLRYSCSLTNPLCSFANGEYFSIPYKYAENYDINKIMGTTEGMPIINIPGCDDTGLQARCQSKSYLPGSIDRLSCAACSADLSVSFKAYCSQCFVDTSFEVSRFVFQSWEATVNRMDIYATGSFDGSINFLSQLDLKYYKQGELDIKTWGLLTRTFKIGSVQLNMNAALTLKLTYMLSVSASATLTWKGRVTVPKFEILVIYGNGYPESVTKFNHTGTKVILGEAKINVEGEATLELGLKPVVKVTMNRLLNATAHMELYAGSNGKFKYPAFDGISSGVYKKAIVLAGDCKAPHYVEYDAYAGVRNVYARAKIDSTDLISEKAFSFKRDWEVSYSYNPTWTVLSGCAFNPNITTTSSTAKQMTLIFKTTFDLSDDEGEKAFLKGVQAQILKLLKVTSSRIRTSMLNKKPAAIKKSLGLNRKGRELASQTEAQVQVTILPTSSSTSETNAETLLYTLNNQIITSPQTLRQGSVMSGLDATSTVSTNNIPYQDLSGGSTSGGGTNDGGGSTSGGSTSGSGSTTNTGSQSSGSGGSNTGIIVGIIIAIVVIGGAATGFYFYRQKQQKQTTNGNVPVEMTSMPGKQQQIASEPKPAPTQWGQPQAQITSPTASSPAQHMTNSSSLSSGEESVPNETSSS